MIKVMIVDDELLVRVGIKSTVQWEKLGLEVVAEAEDGKEAFEKFNICQPDIVITDIRMPVMDGLELIKNIKQINSRVKIIILTCYGEFSYAKDALRLGVFEYIVKPTMMADDLTDILTRACELILQEQEEMNKVSEMEKKLLEEEGAIKEKVILNIIRGIVKENDTESELSKAGVNYYKDNVAILVFQIDDYKTVIDKYNSEKSYMLWGAIQNITTNVISLYCKGVVIQDQKDKYAVAVGLPGKKTEKEIHENIFALANQIQTSLRKYLGISVTMGISDIGYGERAIFRLYQQADTACAFRLFMGCNRIIPYHEIAKCKQDECDYEPVLNQIETYTKDLNVKLVNSALTELFQNRLLPTYNKTLVKKAVFKLLAILTVISRYNLKDSLTADMEYELYEQVMELETLENMYNWFKSKFKLVIDACIDASTGGCCIQVKKAIEYIKGRYMNDISLDDAAEAAHVSRNYLGNLFKRDTGRYFVDFLMEYRVEKAKELLKEYPLKIYDVAWKVGIKDQRYFSKVFKKYTGYTPNEFRDRHIK